MGERMTSKNRIEAVEKQRRALVFRKAGVGFADIARQLGYAGPAGAYKAVKVALQKTLQEPADELRALEAARLDALLLGLWAEAAKGNVAKIDRVLKIMTRRAALFGLDAPTKYADVIDHHKEAAQIAAEIGRPELAGAIARDLLIGHEASRGLGG